MTKVQPKKQINTDITETIQKMIKKNISPFLIRQIDWTKDGYARIATPFCYPNGEYIDLLLEYRPSIALDGQNAHYILHDDGNTYEYLINCFGGMRKLDSTKFISFRRNICNSAGITDSMITRDNGGYEGTSSFYMKFDNESSQELNGFFIKLIQICLQVSAFQMMKNPGS